MRVYIFGDSIAQGYFDAQRGGWANQLAQVYQTEAMKDLDEEWVEVFNLGVSGDNAEGVLGRLKPEVEARRLSDDQECIILAIGINDAILRENRAVTEVYPFQETYEKLIDEALKLCPSVVCVGLSAVDEAQADPWRYSTSGKQWKNNRINLFEDTIKQAAGAKGVVFVPIHDEFLKLTQSRTMLADGLHPNDAGHAFIAGQVLPVVEALK